MRTRRSSVQHLHTGTYLISMNLMRRWSSHPSGKCSYERPIRGTVCGTMRSMCDADAGCSAIDSQSLNEPRSLFVHSSYTKGNQGSALI